MENNQLEKYYQQCGRNIRYYRQQKKMSQAVLGGKANLEKAAVQLLERGSNPTLKTLIKVAHALRFQLQPCYNSIRHLWLPIAIRVLGANRFFVFFKKSLSCIALTTNLFPMRITTLLGLLCIGVSVHAQQNFQAEALEIGKERLDDFVAFLSLPNDGKDKVQLEQNKAWSEASHNGMGLPQRH